MSENKKGVIYILTNPSFLEYVKIGYADDIEVFSEVCIIVLCMKQIKYIITILFLS